MGGGEREKAAEPSVASMDDRAYAAPDLPFRQPVGHDQSMERTTGPETQQSQRRGVKAASTSGEKHDQYGGAMMLPFPKVSAQGQRGLPNTAKSGLVWARAWLAEVGEARKALDRAERISELRRAKAFSIADPLGAMGCSRTGGTVDPMRKVDEMIDGEAEDAAYDWARYTLALFDLMAELNKPIFRGPLLMGLDIAEMKYRLGASDSEVMRSFAIGKSKLHEDLNAFVDYLDYIGPEQAFQVDVDKETAEPDMSPCDNIGPGEDVPHGDAYGEIDALVANCGKHQTSLD